MKILWILVLAMVLLWSAINPKDYLTWALEVAPVIVGVAIIAITWRSFPLTPMVYLLILLHAIILLVGGHYTYAEVPWFEGLFGAERNNYDKLGHFAQGFVPAMIARELVIRKQVFNHAGWRNFFTVCFCLGLSAFYELIEWWVAELSGDDAVEFLGTQGYQWDTQSDMALALLGAVLALLILAKWHDRQMARAGFR